MKAIELPSGCTIPNSAERLAAFCAGEYIYYDAIDSTDQNRIEPAVRQTTWALGGCP